MLVRIMGDPHGKIDPEEDGWWCQQSDLALCTGDFGYRIQGSDRQVAVAVMTALRELEVYTILGNHDGICHHQSLVYRGGEAEPACQEELVRALGSCYVGYRRVDFEQLSLVGGRPFSNGNPGISYVPWPHSQLTVEESSEMILDLIRQAPNKLILLLSHNGPHGLGGERDSLCGRDWKKPHQDWGDQDLALALDRLPENKKVLAVVTGHMHHRLRGGGLRQRVAYYRGIPVVNAAVVPRIVHKGMLESRDVSGDSHEKKIFQTHHHFLDLEFDLETPGLKSASDFWARKGSRKNEGVRFPLVHF